MKIELYFEILFTKAIIICAELQELTKYMLFEYLLNPQHTTCDPPLNEIELLICISIILV